MISVRGLTAWGRGPGDGGAFTLGPVDLDVPPGTLTCVVGPAGSGKSLLLSALVGLAPAEGEVDLADTRLFRDPLPALRRRVGFAFQRDALLDSATALENVALAVAAQTEEGDHLEEQRDRALAALAAVGLQGAENKRPGALSGGMRRRVGLARALAARAPVLLLDDATAGLDPSTAAEILGRLVAFARERPAAVLLTTSDVDTALPHAAEVLVLDDGAVAYRGSPSGIDPASPLAAFAAAPEARLC